MHITLETDYAIRIVYCIAKADRRMDAKTISESANVTLRFSLKILRKLVASGIIKSFKGTQGGYEIGRPLNKISLKDVIETIEGEYNLNRCTNGNFVCSRSTDTPCKFQKVFFEISCDVRDKLDSYKFSDLI